GTAIDLAHPDIGVHPRDRILFHVTVAAMQLQTFIDDLAVQLRGPPLRHGGGGHVQLATDHFVDTIIDETARHRCLPLTLRQFEMSVLHNHTTLTTYLEIIHTSSCLFIDLLHGSHGAKGDIYALARLLLLQLHETHALGTSEDIFRWYANVIKT